MRDAKTSVALYSVSSDVDGAKIVQQMGARFDKAIVRRLATACEPLTTDPQLIASILQGAMVGVSRRTLESGAPEKQFATLSQELIFAACAHLDACSTRLPAQPAGTIGDADEELSSEDSHELEIHPP
jgi:hypothetical protein